MIPKALKCEFDRVVSAGFRRHREGDVMDASCWRHEAMDTELWVGACDAGIWAIWQADEAVIGAVHGGAIGLTAVRELLESVILAGRLYNF